MSKDVKFFFRPKVRFSQNDEEDLNFKAEQENTLRSNKPRIRSIVTLNKPIKLRLKTISKEFDEENENSEPVNDLQAAETSICRDSVIHRIESTDFREAENQKPLSDVNNIQNIEAKSKPNNVRETKALKSSAISNNSENKSLTKTASEFEFQCVTKPEAKALKKISKPKKGKENEVSNSKKSLTKRALDTKYLQQKAKASQSVCNSKKSNTVKSSCTAISKKPSSKYIVAGVMPCNKHKSSLKSKPLVVKKTVIRNTIGPKIMPYVGPGNSNRETSNGSESEEFEARTITNGEKLARPEYNSIMCTINKLNRLKKQKPVTNIESLPASYKKLINEKISSALDFPLDQAIYKNLVDLSIDEKQLPNRLIRSKDPEPRQRDTVPVLSDFFVPLSTEEYCAAVSVKPKIQEAADSWSAFRISDKIFEWKLGLDNV